MAAAKAAAAAAPHSAAKLEERRKPDPRRMEDEAVLDRGASFLKHVCDEEEVEGHHTIYIGVHVPKSYRRRRRHKRKAGHREKKEKERVSENYSDKSDVENADESSSSILKPLRWRMKLSWTEGLPSLSMCVMKKK